MAAGNGGGAGAASGGTGGGPSTSGGAGAAGSPAPNGGMASLKDCGDGAALGKDKKGATMWPGLEPLEGVSNNFEPIGRGVLQPVLTWGSSCAPGSRAGASNYWISSMYVNVTSRERGYNGCYGGKVMDVEFGDKLYIDMRLKEGTTIWNQKVTNLSNNQSVDFDFDLKDQDQNWALFEIEIASSTLPSSDVIFTDSVLSLASAEPEACTPDSFGPNDYYSAPLASKDGTKCCLERIVLREMGVPATTMDP
jgi:hypothetical protein